MTPRSAWLALSLTLALLAPGFSQAADAVRGGKLAYTCHGCHGIPDYRNAYPVYKVPKLGGQHAAYMVAALKEYKSGDRAHPPRTCRGPSSSPRVVRSARRRRPARHASPATATTAWASCPSIRTSPDSTRTTS